MSEARAVILSRLRRAGVEDAATVETRLREHPCGPKPRYDIPLPERFVQRLEAASATVARMDDATALTRSVSQYLAQHDLPRRLVLAPHPRLEGLPWAEDVEVISSPLATDDATAMTVAWAGVAETGSLVLRSSPRTPTRYNFLPDTFICLLDERDLVPHIDDVWTRLRESAADMPRTVNFITGPSRTADVEQTIQLGAHGPRRLHVLIWTGDD